MTIATHIFDPTACGFPKPRVPLLPDGWAGLALRSRARGRLHAASHFRHFSRGRYALREAYRLAGVGAQGALLAPSYHCRTIIDPALALRGQVLLYPLRGDLSPDLDALDKVLATAQQPAKALVAAHFFGFPQRLEALSAWCAARRIALVEDCSHTLYTEHEQAEGIGSYGDFVVGSPYKFLPAPDGGLLWARQAERLDGLAPRQPPLSAELRGLAGTVARARAHRASSQTFDPVGAGSALDGLLASRLVEASDSIRAASWSESYHPSGEGMSPLRLSRLIGRHENVERLSRLRREHYRRWTEGLAGVSGCRALFPDLPDNCIPYMLPLYFEQTDRHFYLLKHLGVPVWRWDSMAVSGCKVAGNYRLHLLHLPCHQSLAGVELDWMIATVRQVLCSSSRATP